MRGKLFEGKGRSKRWIAVGDKVRVEFGAGAGVIEEVLPRSSMLVRRAASERGGDEDERQHVIAANVSLVVVVAALRDPKLQTVLLDRMLAGAEQAGIPAAVVLTKGDLAPGDEAAQLRELYTGLGYPVFVTSLAAERRTETVLAELATLLHANTSVMCGASGIGKSSLLNAIVPGASLRVGEISKVRLGRHTTSHTELVPLQGGGHVLDTPGIRGFELFAIEQREIGRLFPEFRSRSDGCAFRDCRHTVEPKCAIRTALAAGLVAATRYESYLAMLEP